jgi:predicted AlkP superfamily phosphohydrolase/phosphomutase/uncharacterized membrane protein YfcA
MKRFRKGMIALGVVALLAAVLSVSLARMRSAESPAQKKRLLILGIDGMDPQLLRQSMAEGKMSNFAALASRGSFLTLQTSIPPQSPVAWSNLITGMNPGGHDVFDFIHRDPVTLTPYFSTSQVKPPKHNLRFGKWMIPLSEGEVLLLRQGKAFWQYLDERKIRVTVFRIPSNFPPVPNKGKTFAGMGTPDLLGGYGTFSFHTDDPIFTPGPLNGGVIYQVQVAGDHVEGQLHGPANTLRKENPEVTIPFTVDRDALEPVARFSIQDQQFILREHEWSPWIRIQFTFIPGLESITGICRFYLKQVRPQFELYVSPINIDPSNPALPISTPQNYARELAHDVGVFYTQGIAEDTKALTSGVLDDDEYLEQAHSVFEEQRRLFEHELPRFQEGLFFFYFSSLDLNQHMFWRATDPIFPTYDAELAAKHGKVLEEYYREMDGILGETLRAADENTTVLVVSDHGFAPFRRSFNLNTWLVENRYLVLRAGASGQGRDIFRDTDWPRTRAYGLGLNGLYLNLSGREKNGIVKPGAEADALQREIAARLETVRDPISKEQMITRVDRSTEAYSGPYVSQAPDLIVGYNRGYRVGWDSVLGGISASVMEDNTQPWSGDHCIDNTKVPGVVLSNRAIRADNPALTDIAPTVLAEFGIARPATMLGHSIFEPLVRETNRIATTSDPQGKTALSLLPIIAIGVGVGLLLGLTGIGSGSVLTPLLILAGGLAPAKAVGSSLVFAFATKTVASASFFRQGLVDLPILKKLAPGALAGLLLGFLLLRNLGGRSPQLENTFLQRAIGVVLLAVFVLMAVRLFPNTAGHALSQRMMRFTQPHERPLALAAGFAVGLSVTLTSIGAGAALIPALYVLYHPDSGRLVGTSIFFGTVLSAAAGLLHASAGNVDILLVGAMLAGSLPAIWLASHLHGRLPRLVSEGIIATVVLVLGVRFFLR